jgi:hypothetical protein
MNLQTLLVEPTKTLLVQIGAFLTNLLLVILILVIGWLIAKVVKNLITKILAVVKFNVLASRIKADEFLAKGGVKYNLTELIGVVGYWLVLLIALVVAVNAVGLTVAADLLNRIVLYIPNIISAIFILILGMFVATMLSAIVLTTATNAGIAQAKLLGKLVEIVVIIFAIAITLEQLNIGTTIVGLAVNIILASMGLGIALAFGLGCKDIAARIMSEWLDKIKSKH